MPSSNPFHYPIFVICLVAMALSFVVPLVAPGLGYPALNSTVGQWLFIGSSVVLLVAAGWIGLRSQRQFEAANRPLLAVAPEVLAAQSGPITTYEAVALSRWLAGIISLSVQGDLITLTTRIEVTHFNLAELDRVDAIVLKTSAVLQFFNKAGGRFDIMPSNWKHAAALRELLRERIQAAAVPVSPLAQRCLDY
ncbi:MAG TPA: hypothetical protein VLI05_06275 [Candidatus Saccharimonadia bacterium]|nr:hypothetical protein [Candidatus Saccharimonadia bacterium]